MNYLSALLSVLVAFLCLHHTASAAEIRVCEHANMGSPCITLRHGVNDLRDWGMSNRISSFSTNEPWMMCTQPDFRGQCKIFSRSNTNLDRTPLQDNISSLRPVRGGGDGGWNEGNNGSNWERVSISVYPQPNFRGRSWVFSEDIRDLRTIGLSNKISSLRVSGGNWRICKQPNFVSCTTVSRDIPDLNRIGFGNSITSIQEIGSNGNHDGDNSQGAILLYERQGFSGRSMQLNRASSNLDGTGFNDRTSSIRVQRGSWEVCTDANFRGRCRTVEQSLSGLGGFDDKISSVRPISGGN